MPAWDSLAPTVQQAIVTLVMMGLGQGMVVAWKRVQKDSAEQRLGMEGLNAALRERLDKGAERQDRTDDELEKWKTRCLKAEGDLQICMGTNRSHERTIRELEARIRMLEEKGI
jgi:hypothetical protein